MQRMIGSLIVLGMVLGVQAGAEPMVAGPVRLASGEPVAGAHVRLFDLRDLRSWVGTTTDETGSFALPLGALPGAAVQPTQFRLGENYPNPFNPSTVIPYRLHQPMPVRLEVFNVLGQHIATLVDGERSEGLHTARWHGCVGAGGGGGDVFVSAEWRGGAGDSVDGADRRSGGYSGEVCGGVAAGQERNRLKQPQVPSLMRTIDKIR